MRVLLVHNYYKQKGGEDAVFEQEAELLRAGGCRVETLIFDNENFAGPFIADAGLALRTLYNSQSGKQLALAIARFQPDIVHIHNLFYTASASIIHVAKKLEIPVVMTIHNYRLVCVSGLLMREEKIPCETCLTKLVPLAGIKNACFQNSRAKSAQLSAIILLHRLTGIWKQVDRFIALTDFSRQKMLDSSLKLTSEQICVKPNFVADGGYVSPNERDNYFLYVGRLTFDKGIDVLLRAAQMHNFPLHIIGSGPMATNVQTMAEQVKTICYWGDQPRDFVLHAMKRCQALIVPSRWYEGLPTVILEAFASGTPVIHSDQQNLNQIVKNGQTGLSFRIGDSLDLGRVVDRFSRDTEGRKQWSEKAYLEYQTRYTSQVSLTATLAIYNGLVSKKETL